MPTNLQPSRVLSFPILLQSFGLGHKTGCYLGFFRNCPHQHLCWCTQSVLGPRLCWQSSDDPEDDVENVAAENDVEDEDVDFVVEAVYVEVDVELSRPQTLLPILPASRLLLLPLLPDTELLLRLLPGYSSYYYYYYDRYDCYYDDCQYNCHYHYYS